MRKITFVATIFSCLLAQSICLAEANEPDSNGITFRSHRPHRMFRSEWAAINWHDGVQQMVVSPRIARDNNSIWIFPLKCKNEQAKFSLIGSFPQISGTDPREIARTILTNVNYAAIATQLWTIPLCYFGVEKTGYDFSTGMPGSIDSNDVRMELLNADSVETLAQQLMDRGRIVPESELECYAKYLNNDYSLLAVWKEGNEPNLTQSGYARHYRGRPCIYVEFPSEKPFYPMPQKADRQARVSVILAGYWQIAGQEQSSSFQCRQLINQDGNMPDLFKASLPQKDMPFTIISSLHGRGGRIQNDLSFVPGRLEGMAYVDAVSKLPIFALIPLGIILFAGISYISAGISGLLTYRKWLGFANLGFLNLLSIMAVGAAMNYQKSSIGEIFRQDKWKARKFLAIGSVLVVAISFAVFELLKIPFDVI